MYRPIKPSSGSVSIIIWMLLSAAAAIGLITFNVLDLLQNNGIFNNSIADLSKKYETDITPARYAFFIWGLIFLWQAAWIMYGIVSICRINSNGPVLLNPVILPVKFQMFWIASCAGTVAWLFMWDRETLLYASLDLLLITLLGFSALVCNLKTTLKNQESLPKADLISVQVLVQNGLSLFFSWTTVATLLNFSSALTYDPLISPNLSRSASSTFSLCILGVLIIFWSLAENKAFFDLFRYIYAWYFVLIWALTAIIVKNPDVSNTNTIITITLLCLSVMCLVAKILVSVYTPTKKVKGYKRFA